MCLGVVLYTDFSFLKESYVHWLFVRCDCCNTPDFDVVTLDSLLLGKNHKL